MSSNKELDIIHRMRTLRQQVGVRQKNRDESNAERNSGERSPQEPERIVESIPSARAVGGQNWEILRELLVDDRGAPEARARALQAVSLVERPRACLVHPSERCSQAARDSLAVFESLGMQDVVAKSKGSSNPYNMVRATFDALKKQASPRAVAARRGKKVSDVLSRRREIDVTAEQ